MGKVSVTFFLKEAGKKAAGLLARVLRAEMFCVRVLKLCVQAAERKCGATGEETEPRTKKKKRKKQAQHTDKHTSVCGGGVRG